MCDEHDHEDAKNKQRCEESRRCEEQRAKSRITEVRRAHTNVQTWWGDEPRARSRGPGTGLKGTQTCGTEEKGANR